MPSFEFVSNVDHVKVRRAIDQVNKDVSTRFDFKGAAARVEIADKILRLYADDDFKLQPVTGIVLAKLARRDENFRA